MSARFRSRLGPVLAVLLCGLVVPAAASAAPNDGVADNGVANDGVVEIPGPIVIESINPSIDTGDEALLAAFEQHNRSFKPGVTRSVTAPVQSWGAQSWGAQFNATSGFEVTFDATNTPPADVQAVILAAAERWDDALATSPAGPVEIAVSWKNLGSPGLLGSAGPGGLFATGDLPTGSFYPAAQANTLLGTDINDRNSGPGDPSNPEVIVNLNSTPNWYIGVTGSPAGGQVDLFSVVLHELGHGLGFIGSASTDNDPGPGPTLDAPPFVFDELATHNGQPLLNAGDPDSLLQSGNLFINIGNGQQEKLYAPGTWQEGSSFSHFDESANPSGTSGALMTPVIGSGQTERELDDSVLGVFAGMGWPMATVGAPGVVSTSGDGLLQTVSWSAASGPGVGGYEVQRSQDGANWVDVGSTTALSLQTTVAEGVHQFRVRATSGAGAGPFGYSIPAGVSAGIVRPVALDGQISRLYQAYFLREPDVGGFTFWRGERAAGGSLNYVSNAFASSNEFESAYGALSDGDFVELVYQNVFGRPADADGFAHWTQLLAQGLSRGDVMIGLSESAEYVTATGTAAPVAATQDEIYRLYVAFFLRFPDSSGLDYWLGQRNAGASLETVAAAFASSNEFVTTYGSLPDDDFVELVYNNVLARSADGAGSSYWEGQLGAGVDRGSVMVGFSESTEFVLTTGTLP